MENQPLILVSNDDGVFAQGIRHLVRYMSELGEVVVVAPDSPQSGMGHAITVAHTLRLDRTDLFGEDVEAYECSGTPADCIKIAKQFVLKERQPDLVVSGINHGPNSSVNAIYSGTMSAAIEGAMEGYPSIGFSLCDYDHNAHFDHTKPHVQKIAQLTLEKGLGKHLALNVNIPAKNSGEIQGMKICRQAHARWVENFLQRKDPSGRDYFWLVGEFVNMDKGEDTDLRALDEGFVSIVPCMYDLTAHHAVPNLNRDWEL